MRVKQRRVDPFPRVPRTGPPVMVPSQWLGPHRMNTLCVSSVTIMLTLDTVSSWAARAGESGLRAAGGGRAVARRAHRRLAEGEGKAAELLRWPLCLARVEEPHAELLVHAHAPLRGAPGTSGVGASGRAATPTRGPHRGKLALAVDILRDHVVLLGGRAVEAAVELALRGGVDQG